MPKPCAKGSPRSRSEQTRRASGVGTAWALRGRGRGGVVGGARLEVAVVVLWAVSMLSCSTSVREALSELGACERRIGVQECAPSSG